MARDPIEELLRLLVSRELIANTISAERRARIRELFERLDAIFRAIDPPGAKRDRYRRDRTERALREIQDELRKVAPELERALRDDLARVGRHMGERARSSIVSSLGTQDPDLFSVDVGVTQQRMRAILNTDPIQGRTLREHTRTWAAAQYNRVRDQIRLGMSAEESTEDIMRRVIGSQAGFQSKSTGRMRKTGGPGAVRLYRGGVYSKAARDAEAIVRTAVTHVSNVGMMETFRANAELLAGVEYVATLDDRTCFVAGTGVLSPRGYRPIESIRPGDIVIGGSREPRRVVATRRAHKSEMARVSLSNGEVVECTADHRWLRADGAWVEAGELEAGDSLAHNATMCDISWHEDMPNMRYRVRAAPRESEQVLRAPVLSGRAETRGLHRHSRHEGAVRYVRGDARPDEVQEAGRESGGPPLLLSRVLPGAPHQEVHGGVRGMREEDAAHTVPGEGAEVLLPGVPDRAQAPRPDQLPGVWSPVHPDPDTSQREHRLQGRPDALLRRVLQPLGIGRRGAEAEDRGRLPGTEASELEGRAVLPVESLLPWAALEQGGGAGPEAGWLSLRGVREDAEGERAEARRAPRRAVSQLREREEGQRQLEPPCALHELSRRGRGNDRRSPNHDGAGSQRLGPADLSHLARKRAPQGEDDRGDRQAGTPGVRGRTVCRQFGRRARRDEERHGQGGEPHDLEARAVTVAGVELFSRPTTVYDIQVERDHSFVVADVVVHNSALCMSLDGTFWPLDSDEIVIPGENTHYGCRSILVGIPDWEKLGIEPPPEGTRIARDMRTVSDDDLDRAVSNRRRTSGFGKVERIPSSVIAEEWLRQQRGSVQRRVLGATRANLFRSGEVSLAEMIRSDNTLIPLDELLRN